VSALGRAVRGVLGAPGLWMARHSQPQRVLVLGVYMRGKPNLAPSIAAALAASRHQVQQSWAAIGAGEHGVAEMQALTALSTVTPIPKFALLNQLLKLHDLRGYTHVLVTDDDIELPPRFLDTFIGLQQRYGFALAQPARTQQSNVDHPVTLESHARMARQTRFVEIGPLFCVAAAAFPVLMPFDESFDMGWGLDHVWPIQLEQAGLRLGVVDVTAVHHRFRPVASTYSGDGARAHMAKVLQGRQAVGSQDLRVPLRSYWW
jgi:hypothetical protein